ncbi:hypothetical protein F4781DRAFT_432990 [Annulohypoxylon bovei var. microspora]|nr:hypothetical protein F4781DRAFT_432990 [Annulohypoxylon bovei var. microspora]
MASEPPPPPPPPPHPDRASLRPPPGQTPPATSQILRPPRRVKLMVFTGAFAAVAIVGAIYGAGLKTQREFKKEKQKIVEASAEDRIRDLEGRRGTLVSQRIPLERKLNDLRARMRVQEAKDTAAAVASDGGRK